MRVRRLDLFGIGLEDTIHRVGSGASLYVCQIDHLVTESCRDLFQGLPSCLTIDISILAPVLFCSLSSIVKRCLREVEICDDQEEEAAADEDVVIVLFDVCKGAGPCLGDCNMLTHWLVACIWTQIQSLGQHFHLLPTFTMK